MCHTVNQSFFSGEHRNRLRISSGSVLKQVSCQPLQGLGHTSLFIPFILSCHSTLQFNGTVFTLMLLNLAEHSHMHVKQVVWPCSQGVTIAQWLEPLPRKQWVDWIRRPFSVKYMPRWIPWTLFAAAQLAPSDCCDIYDLHMGYQPRMRSRLLNIAPSAKFSFCVFIYQDHKHAEKRNDANIQQSWQNKLGQ